MMDVVLPTESSWLPDAAWPRSQRDVRHHYASAAQIASGASLGPAWKSTVYTLQIDELMALAQQRLTRSLTPEECRAYLHLDICPSP